MKALVKLLLVMILGTTLLLASAFSKNVKHRSTKAYITAEKPLTTGSNTLKFKITKSGKKLHDTKVFVRAFMPAMPGMPAMESKEEAKDLGNGIYQATLNLAMSGTWQLYIYITPKTGKKSRLKTTVTF